ncbi:zonadhesin-like isoform X2 [Arctopsyche grandis]|uniref:zonadhesin-like isoform X2 n=1 Tax=Arctopsyche grandis TaxID=121162 RepID=UPI00406D78B6
MSRFLHLAVLVVVVCSVAATVIPQPSCNGASKEYRRPTRPTPKPCNDQTPKPCDEPPPPPPPKCSKANEIYILATTGEATCDDLSPRGCAPVKECRCRDGYVRYNGNCIKPCDCPVKCKDPNEEYVLARTGEPTCDNPNPYSCVPVTECRCKSGYVRDRGVCIKQKYCPIKCKDVNEEVVLAKYSEPSCDEPTTKEITPVEECRCRSGYVRYNGKCVLPIECPSKCTNMFEEYVTANMSEPTCSKPVAVPIAWVKECRCAQGFVRDNGKCILPITCSCPVNEMYITAIFSERTCDNQTPKPIDPPVSGCQCTGAYVRENGKCILPSDCPIKCADPNEEYINAIFSEMTCSEQVQRSISPVKECRCKPGYLRDSGKCVLPSTCPVVCPDPMEEYVQVTLSEPSCANPRSYPVQPTKECRCRSGFLRNNGRCIIPNLCPCSNVNEEFATSNLSEPTCTDSLPKIVPEVIGCRCKNGYVRDGGVCIPPSECPPICTENEEYVMSLFSEPTCIDTVLRPVTPVKECRCKPGLVRNNGKCVTQSECPVQCPDSNEEYVISQYSEPTCTNTIPSLIVTVQECRCKNGYVRDSGRCILPNSCPVICPDENEEYVTCLFSEPSCVDRVPKTITPSQECRCKPGYLRDNGKCVRVTDCPVVCSDSNAEYVLAQLSEPTCANPTPFSIAPIKECRCKAGYVKYNGKCVLPTDCPAVCRDPNEENVLTYFSEPTCANQIPTYMSVPVQECRCKAGYVRENGKCIMPSTCPAVCSDPNEEYILAFVGELTCDSQLPAPCSPVKECRCKAGYVRYNGNCVQLSACPSRCGDPNEEYITTMYEERTCANPNPSICSTVTECRCRMGMLRSNGKCIMPSECPCGPNEVYSLQSPVEAESCSNLGKPRCPDTKPGCMCINDYVRDCSNKCIPKCDCPRQPYGY